jgi:hypothetical protein
MVKKKQDSTPLEKKKLASEPTMLHSWHASGHRSQVQSPTVAINPQVSFKLLYYLFLLHHRKESMLCVKKSNERTMCEMKS